MCYKVTVLTRRYHLSPYFPRLKFVFFKISPTLTWEMLSTYSSSTILSASKRNDYPERPAGGSLQHSVTRRASRSPSIFRSYLRVVGRRSRTASRPSSMNRFLHRSMVRPLTFSILLISSFVALSDYSPSSQFSKI